MSARLSVDVRVRRRDVVVAADIVVEPGEVLAVMGPSGAGKSTLLEAVAGLVPLEAGSVRVDDETVASPGHRVAPQRRGIVLLRQDPCLFPHLSARENVAFGLRSRGEPARRARAVADGWLERVGLAGSAGQHPRALSGGQQQRVALARALAAGPRVILLDEPFTALDPATAASLRTMLAEQVRAAGTTAVLVSHDALDAAAAADRLVVLESGTVTQRGTVREVLRAPTTAFGAAIAGLNRVEGRSHGGRWTAGGIVLDRAGDEASAAAALFRPGEVIVHPLPPQARDTAATADGGDHVSWEARVVRLEPTVGGVRVFVDGPALVVDLPVDRAADLRPGDSIRLSLPTAAVVWA
ncbi:sulfate/molybdate ABC transporter ATP-binding protein [Microbacterium sp. cf332]|uniref:sulfate/molybdate ABC transporter ATP-binding protein n=1 Tax=Microbacterium sp. cf332 TaxID=1761804 RepID=UPI000888DA1F|nr:ABC transporter ATP-binding protein [Microbacterium sp. cf332]SDQ23847.1 molybdate transport system ATP-binding protein [Microbacterium sp. cf332]